jgi:non-ribosomal peptide synthetase component E (peptide arylation enzyme)
MGRALDDDRAPETDFAVRVSAGNLVAAGTGEPPVILGGGLAADVPVKGGATLDAMFCRTLALRPDAVALADPPDRDRFTDGKPRRLTYADANRIVSAIAVRLRQLGLATDSVVAVQLPNTVEHVLTVLAVLRAGMIAAPLPLVWRRADLIAALGRVGAKAIVTTSRICDVDHGELARQVAGALFQVRHVCAFGSRLGDGIIPLDDLLGVQPEQAAPAIEREGDPAAHVAVLTFDVTSQGLVVVARNHRQMIAGGLVVLLEGRIDPGATLLGCCTMSSFAGLALTVLPWLLAGGTLSLHQPFDSETFATQCKHGHGVTVALPGALVPRLADAGLLARPEVEAVVAAWRAPERLMTIPPCASTDADIVDLLLFGETALLRVFRDASGTPLPLPAGVVQSGGAAGSVTAMKIVRTEGNTLALRGPMVPRHAFPPGAERASMPHVQADAQGFVDTGYACRFDRESGMLTITAPPPGLVSIGGCRFALRDMEEAVRRVDRSAGLAALPDALSGHRLAGSAQNPQSVRAALAADGANALLIDAFRDRRARDAA